VLFTRTLHEFCEVLVGVLGPVPPERQWVQRVAIVFLLIAITAVCLFVAGLVYRSSVLFVAACGTISLLSSLVAGSLGRALQQ